MSIATRLHEELLSLYRRTGEATGYWPSYFHRDVREKGGLVVAKRLLAPGQVSSGFDRLIAVCRADLSVEAIATSAEFSDLFTDAELNEARLRLSKIPSEAFPKVGDLEAASIDGLDEGASFSEGAVLRVTVNRYERDPKARASCINHFGPKCSVCDLDFGQRYGKIGAGFIHVHHNRPLAQLKGSYRVDPKKDLIPVCPNCHWMLHRRKPA